MDLEKKLEKVLKHVDMLTEENKQLREENTKLKQRLAVYENPHTPPSLRRGWRKPPKSMPGRIGAPKGHNGTTRPKPKPDKIVDVKPLKHCPKCNARLLDSYWMERRFMEDIPEPQPITVTLFNLPHHICPCCGEEVSATHPDCPDKGRFGFNTQAHVTLLKYDGRLPHRKVAETLERDFGLTMTPTTVLDINSRVTDKVKPKYEQIVKRVRASPHAYVDETGIKVAGKKYWVWIFVTETDCLVVIRPSRGKKVLVEVLSKNYSGTIICDGLKSYSNFTKKLQRCWAHLLREAKFVAKHAKEAEPLNKALHRLYERLATNYRNKLSKKERWRLWKNAKETLRRWINKPTKHNRLKQLAEKIRNGFQHWFTFILNPTIEPTNNTAERALREHVVIRKIIGCLRNQKGTTNHETIMSLLATWKMRELNIHTELIKALRS